MTVSKIALFALAAFVSCGASASKDEFPLVWVCLGITIVGIAIALYVAYRRPDELHLPGSTVMTVQESEPADGGYPNKATEPTGAAV